MTRSPKAIVFVSDAASPGQAAGMGGEGEMGESKDRL